MLMQFGVPILSFKIVADSSSNVFEMEDIAYSSVPLKIITSEKEYVDDTSLNVEAMVDDLRKYTGRSGSSCPNAQEWTEAFENFEHIFAIAITSNLSGSFNAAKQAAQDYLNKFKEKKVCVIDSLSTGPEMLLIIEKIKERVLAGDTFEKIESAIKNYQQHTHLLFSLKSLNNLARNGRVNPAVAKIAGVLGIHAIGKASDVGTLEMLHKCRGEKKALSTIFGSMKEMGFAGGKVRIDHCFNLEAATELKNAIIEAFPKVDVKIGTCHALCSFYAERGGLLIGFEDGAPA